VVWFFSADRRLYNGSRAVGRCARLGLEPAATDDKPEYSGPTAESYPKSRPRSFWRIQNMGHLLFGGFMAQSWICFWLVTPPVPGQRESS
jgi:hypothetical protein